MNRHAQSAFCLLLVVTLACPIQAKGVRHAIVQDHALLAGGALLGRVIDENGDVVSGAPVTLRSQNQIVCHSVTDEQGQFQFIGLRGGVYQLQTLGNQSVHRLWTLEAAPPAAEREPLIIRGQGDYPGLGLITPYTATWAILGLGVTGLVLLAVNDAS